jgi:hypothetical protein
MTVNPKMPNLCNPRHPLHFTTALAILEKLGIDTNTINILAVGEYKNYQGEVIEQKPAAGTSLGPNPDIELRIGFWSAVDYMPYQFFYGLKSTPQGRGGWEEAARRFMAPFDASVIRYKTAAMRTSLAYNVGVIEDEHINRFLELFDFELLKSDKKELLFWYSIMPTYNRWAGNPAYIEKILTYFTGYRCEIVENIEVEFEIPESAQNSLGSSRCELGRDLTIGRSFSECDSGYEVIVHDVSSMDMKRFLRGGVMWKKIEKILEICMPNNFESRITVKGRAQGVKIGKKEYLAFLGYSSYL